MNIINKDLKRRIIEISYKHKLSHLGSCLTAVDIIKEIYDKKEKEEKFVLSSGHSGLALYVVLESKGGRNAEDIFKHHGIHPDRCSECDLSVSTGSLGQGLPISVGMALSNRKKNVYCLISDGELAEGSIWESFRIMGDYNINNLKVTVNFNGWGAYHKIDALKMIAMERAIIELTTTSVQGGKAAWMSQVVFKKTDSQMPFLQGQDAHYYTMNKEDYEQAMELLK